jgi:hypothetical protein
MCKLKGSGTANHSHDPSPTAVIFAIDSSKTASLGTLTICVIDSALSGALGADSLLSVPSFHNVPTLAGLFLAKVGAALPDLHSWYVWPNAA